MSSTGHHLIPKQIFMLSKIQKIKRYGKLQIESIFKYFLVACLLLFNHPFFLSAGKIFAQKTLDSLELAQINTKIDQYEQTASLDSLIYFSQKKLALLKEADVLAGWVNAYLDLALLQPETTLSFLDTMNIQIWRLPKNPEEKEALTWCYMYQGYYLKEANDILGSAKAYERARDYYLDHSPEDFDFIEWVYKPLGNHYTRLGDNEKAINHFTRAISLARGQYSENTLAGLYNNLGLAYWNQAKYTQAIEQYQKGLAIKDLNTRNKALLLSNLAGSYFDSGKEKEAFNTAIQAEQLLSSLQNDDQVSSWIAGNKKLLGIIYLKRKNYKQAQLNLLKGLSALGGEKTRQAAKIYIELGKVKKLEGNFKEALQFYNQALQSILPSFSPVSETENPKTSDLYEENTLFEALTAKADLLLKRYQSDSNLEWLKASLGCHQLAAKAENLLRQTYQYQSSKLRLQGFSRQRSEQAIEVAYQLSVITKDQKYILNAFEFVEQNKATLLLEAVYKNLAFRQIGSQDSLIALEQQLQSLQEDFTRRILEAKMAKQPSAQIEKLNFRKKEAEEKLAAVAEEIEIAYPAFQEVKNQLNSLSIKALQERLSLSQTQLIEYFEGKEALYIFYINGIDSVQMKKVLLDDTTQSIFQSLRYYFTSSKAIANDPLNFLKKSNEVYKILLGSFEDPIFVQRAKLIIIPDGQINFIPFEALLTQVPPNTNLASAPYLIKKMTISYAFSASLWQLRKANLNLKKKKLLVMAPVFAKGEQEQLPLENSLTGSKRLAKKVKNSNFLSHHKASLANFKKLAGQYNIIHLATHASAEGQASTPDISFIDSSLYLPEIYHLKIPADLIVLSACETNLGELELGEGVMSLARGFYYAGARGLISSLWKVNDATTSTLFSQFYESMLKKESISNSLSLAKLSYLDDSNISDAKKSPYYWAGFLFIGQDQILDIEASNGFSPWLLASLGLLIFCSILFLMRKKSFR